jgi:hypothetical protein
MKKNTLFLTQLFMILSLAASSALAEIASVRVADDARSLEIVDLKLESSVVGKRWAQGRDLDPRCPGMDESLDCRGRWVPVYQVSPVLSFRYVSRTDARQNRCDSEVESCAFARDKAEKSVVLRSVDVPTELIRRLQAKPPQKVRQNLALEFFSASLRRSEMTFSKTVNVGCDYNSEGDEVRCGGQKIVLVKRQILTVSVEKIK